MDKLKKNKLYVTIIIIFLSLSSLLICELAYMWQSGLIKTSDGSKSLSVFAKAADFLSNNLNQDDIAIVPLASVFYVLNPNLHGKLVDYASIWNLADVIFQANTTETEIEQVRTFLMNYVSSNPNVKFVARDWVDSYASALYANDSVNRILWPLEKVQTFTFTLSTDWSAGITIYGRVKTDLL